MFGFWLKFYYTIKCQELIDKIKATIINRWFLKQTETPTLQNNSTIFLDNLFWLLTILGSFAEYLISVIFAVDWVDLSFCCGSWNVVDCGSFYSSLSKNWKSLTFAWESSFFFFSVHSVSLLVWVYLQLGSTFVGTAGIWQVEV